MNQFKSFLKLEKVSQQLESLVKRPGLFHQDRIDKLRNEIDLQREECIMKINMYSDECLAELQQHEDECNPQVAKYTESKERDEHFELSDQLRDTVHMLTKNAQVGVALKDINRSIQRAKESIRAIHLTLSNDKECFFVPNKDKINKNEFAYFAIHQPKSRLHENLIHFWPMQGTLKDTVGKKNLLLPEDVLGVLEEDYSKDRHAIPQSALNVSLFSGRLFSYRPEARYSTSTTS